MKALQSELEPKVHRADITVLKGKLKGKTEFLMKMPLTDLQMALYAEYVDWMLGVARREEPETSTLWAWLGELRLLCNHPLCFAERLEEKLKAKQELATNTQEHRPFGKKKRKSNSVLDESDLITSGDERTVLAAARGPAVSTTMMDKQLEIIKKLDVPLDSASLALKMQVLEQILEFARKAGDKALVFSHSLRTLTFIASMLRKKHVESIRIDGGVMTSKRQEIVKNFNTGPITVALISTTAGGQGLNMFGAIESSLLTLTTVLSGRSKLLGAHTAWVKRSMCMSIASPPEARSKKQCSTRPSSNSSLRQGSSTRKIRYATLRRAPNSFSFTLKSLNRGI